MVVTSEALISPD